MAGKKQQPNLSEMISVLLEQIENNKKNIDLLRDLNNSLQLKTDKLNNYNPVLDTKNLKEDLEILKKTTELHKSEMKKIVENHLENIENQKNEEHKNDILRTEEIKKSNQITIEYILLICIIIILLFFSVRIYKMSQEIVFILMEIQSTVQTK